MKPNNDLPQQIKERLNLVDIVAETVELAKHGRYYTGFCPFHANQNTPAFAVWPLTQTWRCFGSCATGGDIIAYVMKRDNLDYRQALEMLAKRANLELRPEHNWSADREPRQVPWQQGLRAICNDFHENLFRPAGASALAWLNARGLNNDTLRHFKVGYNPASKKYGQHYLYGGITIPHLHQNTIWGCKIRLSQEGITAWRKNCWRKNPQKIIKKSPKYISAPGSQQCIFNANQLPAPIVLLCEGEPDTMLAWQEVVSLGVAPVSLGSATAKLSYQWAKYTLPTQKFLLALDNDPAGRNSRAIWQAVVGERGVNVPLPAGHDLTDYYLAYRSLVGLIARAMAQSAESPPPSDGSPPTTAPLPVHHSNLWNYYDYLLDNDLQEVPGSLRVLSGGSTVIVKHAG